MKKMEYPETLTAEKIPGHPWTTTQELSFRKELIYAQTRGELLTWGGFPK